MIQLFHTLSPWYHVTLESFYKYHTGLMLHMLSGPDNLRHVTNLLHNLDHMIFLHMIFIGLHFSIRAS